MTTALTEFLLARIDEDEAEARAHDASEMYLVPKSGLRAEDVGPGWVLATAPARVLAECKAKRAIVERGSSPAAHAGQDIERQWVLLAMAGVYADHPDYQQAWSR